MAATKLNMNITAVSVCGTSLTKVVSAGISGGAQWAKHSADGDKFHTTAVNNMNEPKITITTNDVGTAEGLRGTTGSTSITAADAKGAVGGAVVWSLANSFVENVEHTNQHLQYSSSVITVGCVSTDGTTNPLTYTRS